MSYQDPFSAIRTHLTETARLNPDERSSLWNRIHGTATKTISPYPIHGSFSYRSHIHEYITALIVLGLLGSVGGVSAAAEQSIPGSALYPIKLQITEPMREMVLLTPSARADWQVTLVERRLTETREVLQQTKQPDPETLDVVTNQIQQHAEKAQELISEIIKTDTNEGIRISVSLASTIEKNIEVIKIENEISEETPLINTPSTNPLSGESNIEITAKQTMLPKMDEKTESQNALDDLLSIAESVQETAQETTSILVEQSGDKESSALVSGVQIENPTPNPLALEFDQVAIDIDLLVLEIESKSEEVKNVASTRQKEELTLTGVQEIYLSEKPPQTPLEYTTQKGTAPEYRSEFLSIIQKKVDSGVTPELLTEIKKLRKNLQVILYSPESIPENAKITDNSNEQEEKSEKNSPLVEQAQTVQSIP